jgi:hypothetical protein
MTPLSMGAPGDGAADRGVARGPVLSRSVSPWDCASRAGWYTKMRPVWHHRTRGGGVAVLGHSGGDPSLSTTMNFIPAGAQQGTGFVLIGPTLTTVKGAVERARFVRKRSWSMSSSNVVRKHNILYCGRHCVNAPKDTKRGFIWVARGDARPPSNLYRNHDFGPSCAAC